ncbi:MAG TPA: tetratricopeptide repeat protein [Anaerolineales bacterium]|nr:tetratricopeptide repeat protein [Anaerolineales bacterium]
MKEQKNPATFGQWLRLRRKALDITQAELAKCSGCSIGAVRKIEAGERRPSRQLAGLFAKALEISGDNQQIFIRVARGDINLDRLNQISQGNSTDSLEISLIQQTHNVVSPRVISKPPASRIPLQANPIFGRENEYAALEKLFVDQQCHLLTLTGIGGIGKTRLAIEFALTKQSIFPGGIFYFPLTSVKSSEEVVPAIAEVIDYAFSGPASPKEQLFNYLSNTITQRALFVLDNLEHLLPKASSGSEKPGLVELICEILQHLPNIYIMGTSRERLNIQGEWIYELHGLSVPPMSFAGPIEEYDSVSLFLNSAQRLNVDFQVGIEEQPYLVRICQLLDGIPLAIELAAAWAGMLTCKEIAQEIETNLDFLTTSMRNIPERHRSLRATFDHSWKLLTDDESEALCQMSVFSGSFDRKAASQIAGASLPLLASLCDKSLVRHIGGGRYNLHEVIRQYASSHLDDHLSSLDAYERHCEYYLTLLGSYEKSLKSGLQQESMRKLADEIDNIRSAWSWAIAHDKFTQLDQAGRAYGWYFEIAGLLQEGIKQFELLVETVKAKPKDNRWQRMVGLALNNQALLTFRTGEFDLAQKLYEESIDILRLAGDKPLLADGLIYLGIILHLGGKYEQAKSVVDEGLILAQECNDRWIEAYAIYNLGYLDSLKGNYANGYTQMMAGLAMWRDIGDPFSIALGLNFLVSTLIKLKRYKEAQAFMLESIDLCEQTRNRWGMGTAYRYLGLAEMAANQYAEAEAHFRKSLEIFGDYTIGWDIARSLTYLGEVIRISGDLNEARKYYLDALRISIEGRSIPSALAAIAGLSSVQAQVGNIESALMLCYYILNHSSSEEETREHVKAKCTDLERIADPEQIMLLQKNAINKTFAEIVAIASASP